MALEVRVDGEGAALAGALDCCTVTSSHAVFTRAAGFTPESITVKVAV